MPAGYERDSAWGACGREGKERTGEEEGGEINGHERKVKSKDMRVKRTSAKPARHTVYAAPDKYQLAGSKLVVCRVSSSNGVKRLSALADRTTRIDRYPHPNTGETNQSSKSG